MFLLWFVITVLVRVSTDASPLGWRWSRNIASDPSRAKVVCDAFALFNKKQRDFCIKHADLMEHVFHGAKRGVEECAQQLSNNRWDCSKVPEQGSLFGPILKAGCRESAFLYAITSAGVAHSITAACTSGEYTSCGCDRTKRPSPNGDWEWRGCHSNVKFGSSLTKQFANARDTKVGSSMRKKMNRHNIRAGVRMLARVIYKKCKCHGVSGSCDFKTCWMQHPKDFEAIGHRLRVKYNEAVEMAKTRFFLVKGKRSRKPSSNDLIYYEPSPNFCDVDLKHGTPGTTDRFCNITSTGVDGCNLLCCGRGYNVQVVSETVKCNCRFFWCCHVKCNKCRQKREIYTCK